MDSCNNTECPFTHCKLYIQKNMLHFTVGNANTHVCVKNNGTLVLFMVKSRIMNICSNTYWTLGH